MFKVGDVLFDVDDRRWGIVSSVGTGKYNLSVLFIKDMPVLKYKLKEYFEQLEDKSYIYMSNLSEYMGGEATVNYYTDCGRSHTSKHFPALFDHCDPHVPDNIYKAPFKNEDEEKFSQMGFDIGKFVGGKNTFYDRAFDKMVDKYGHGYYLSKMAEKFARIDYMVLNGKDNHESIEDSLKDLIGYAMLTLNYRNEN